MFNKDKIRARYIDGILNEIEYHAEELEELEQEKLLIESKIEKHKLTIEYKKDILKEFTGNKY